jgi:ferric-dicitrate binding protein FerR (iron transport regulator)
VRLQGHLESCANCRERAALWRGLVPGMRLAIPAAPDAMTARRMQITVERELAQAMGPRPARRWAPLWIGSAAAVVAAAALVALWLRPAAAPPTGWVVAELHGTLAAGERPLARAATVPTGAVVALAAGGQAALQLGAATLAVDGPAHLVLEGSARDVKVRLLDGSLQAAVSHRHDNESFAVATSDLRVEVRGTRFRVTAGRFGSRVGVDEGRVLVSFTSDRSDRFLSAGESVATAGTALDDEAPVAPDSAPADVLDEPTTPAPAPLPTHSRAAGCGDAVRACQGTARTARASMRDGDPARALRLVTDTADAVDPRPACGAPLTACHDELRYLRAEALNQAGRLDDAIGAYRALDRRGAPAAMRQNALYAAARIEMRQARVSAARADFERALAAAPRGALCAEAMAGAMTSAQALGDGARARELARRYLEEFPGGLAAADAGRLASGAPLP